MFVETATERERGGIYIYIYMYKYIYIFQPREGKERKIRPGFARKVVTVQESARPPKRHRAEVTPYGHDTDKHLLRSAHVECGCIITWRPSDHLSASEYAPCVPSSGIGHRSDDGFFFVFF